jgi:hypothetical protein
VTSVFSLQAFSSSVVERISENKSSNQSKAETSHDKPVRMSRFKARKQGLDQT